MKTNQMMILRLLFGVVLVLLVLFAASPLVTPRALGPEVSAARFSAGRAMQDLEVVARTPHAAGSPEQAAVRDYLISQITALGLSAETQTSGQVTNILVRLPGTDPTLTVLVSGHYDSHPPAPGAGDDGVSTVAMLESLRVLKSNPPLGNDVLFLFTDGEELGWLGAKAFIQQYPDARQTNGVVLVFDARPGNAPLMLSETSPGDGWLVSQMTGIPLRVWAGSWNNREERTELNTEFDAFQAAGFTGVVFENEQNGTRYHTERDTVDAISPGLVQAYGQTILALTNRFGSLDLNTKTTTPDLTYFNAPVLGLIAYPDWIMSILSSLGILAFIACGVYAWQMKSLAIKNLLLGLGGLLLGIVLSVGLAQIVWSVVVGAHTTEISAYGRFETSAAWQAGLMLAASFLMAASLAILSRRLGWVNLAAAGIVLYLGIFTVVYLALDSDHPLTTPSIAWPFLGSLVGMAALLFGKNPISKWILLSVSALIILVLMIPSLWLATYTAEDAWIPALATSVVLCLFAPLVEAGFGKALTFSDEDLSTRKMVPLQQP